VLDPENWEATMNIIIAVSSCNKDGDAAFLGRNQKFENPSL